MARRQDEDPPRSFLQRRFVVLMGMGILLGTAAVVLGLTLGSQKVT
jgi:hypothetical protein